MRPVARRTDPATSHEAAWSLGDLTELQDRVRSLLFRVVSATDEQLVDAYIDDYGPVSPSTVRTRRRELQDLGVVEVCGTGRTRGGRSCQVFRITQSTLFPAS